MYRFWLFAFFSVLRLIWTFSTFPTFISEDLCCVQGPVDLWFLLHSMTKRKTLTFFLHVWLWLLVKAALITLFLYLDFFSYYHNLLGREIHLFWGKIRAIKGDETVFKDNCASSPEVCVFRCFLHVSVSGINWDFCGLFNKYSIMFVDKNTSFLLKRISCCVFSGSLFLM